MAVEPARQETDGHVPRSRAQPDDRATVREDREREPVPIRVVRRGSDPQAALGGALSAAGIRDVDRALSARQTSSVIGYVGCFGLSINRTQAAMKNIFVLLVVLCGHALPAAA